MNEAASHRLAVLAWTLAGAAVCAWMTPLEPNLLEEGIILHLAQRMMQGEHLFRDLASFTGPFPFELLAMLFRLFGDELFVARGAVAVMQGLACGAVYAIARAARTGPLSHVAAAFTASAPILLFPLFSLYFYAVTVFHLSLYATWAGTRGLRSVRAAFLAGVFVALAALCKQNVGAALAATLGISLVASVAPHLRLARARAYAAGGLSVALATLALYGVRGDLGALYESLVTLPLSFSDSFDAPYMNLWPPGVFRDDIFVDRARYVPSLYGFKYGVFGSVGAGAALFTQILYAAPFVALAVTAVVRLRRPLPASVWIHTATLVALISNLFPRTDWGHLVYVLPSSFVQLGLLARPARGARAASAVLLTGLAVATLSTGHWLHDRAGGADFGPRVPLRAVSGMLQDVPLPRAIELLRASVAPGEPIFVARSEPLIYFATDTTNPTPYSGVIPGIREEQQERIVSALRRVRYAVMSDIDQPAFLYYSDELPAVQDHLERYFRVDRQMPPSWLSLLTKGKDRGPTAIDFFDRRASGRYFVRDENGNERPAPTTAARLATRQNRRILAFPLGPMGGGVDFEIEVPAESFVQASVGLWQTFGLRRPWNHPRDVTLRIAISQGEGFEVLVERLVLYGLESGERWQGFSAPLDGYAGESVTLRFELDPSTQLDDGELGWFGSPRVAFVPGSHAAIKADRAAREGRGSPSPASSSTAASRR